MNCWLLAVRWPAHHGTRSQDDGGGVAVSRDEKMVMVWWSEVAGLRSDERYEVNLRLLLLAAVVAHSCWRATSRNL